MAKDNEFKFYSKTVDKDNTIHAGFDLETSQWEAKQNVQQYIEHARLEREKEAYYGRNKSAGYRKLATIPDIVAIKIFEDHKLDLHDPAFMQDPNNLKKLKKILMSEYADLLVNT